MGVNNSVVPENKFIDECGKIRKRKICIVNSYNVEEKKM